ncbi:MAG: pentapeptide repeat-containing protein [Candidatus Methylomirabilales bacterium]
MQGQPCKHAEACGLPGPNRVGQDVFCVLHLPPGAGKSRSEFERILNEKLEAGHGDFRYIRFPEDYQNPSFSGRVFSAVADFRGVHFSGALDLSRCTLEQGAFFGDGSRLGHIRLNEAVVKGPLRINAHSPETTTLDLNSAVLRDVEIRVGTESFIHVRAYRAHFEGSVLIEAPRIGTLDLRLATLKKGLQLRGTLVTPSVTRNEPPTWNFAGMELSGVLDLAECIFRGALSLEGVMLSGNVVLDLTSTLIDGNLIVDRLQALPSDIVLDRARIHGMVRIVAALDTAKPRVRAQRFAPSISGQLQLANVDLSQFRLVANEPLPEVTLSNIQWAELQRRSVVYDEVLLRRGESVSVTKLREIYQALKEKYRTIGNHRASGDFHYGEMEMTRREYRHWWARCLGIEAWYWLANGYGTRPLRAASVLACLLLLFASWYLWNDAWAFDRSEWKALRFSLAVGTLQRPDIPPGFSELGSWLYRIESIIVPVQIALFGWAVRMRVRR